MGYYIILYDILLLFGGLFISGGLRPLPKWPIVSASPARMPATEVMRYGRFQLGPNFPHAGFFAVHRTFLNTESLGANGLSFILASYPCLNLCW